MHNCTKKVLLGFSFGCTTRHGRWRPGSKRRRCFWECIARVQSRSLCIDDANLQSGCIWRIPCFTQLLMYHCGTGRIRKGNFLKEPDLGLFESMEEFFLVRLFCISCKRTSCLPPRVAPQTASAAHRVASIRYENHDDTLRVTFAQPHSLSLATSCN